MRRLELLIDIARQKTGDTRYDADSGRSQGIYTQMFQNAQDYIFREMVNAKSKLYLTSENQTIVNQQEFYSYPADIYLANVDTVEWSTNAQDFVFLDKDISKSRLSNQSGYAFAYIPKEGGFLVTPKLESGTLRVTYIRQIKRLEKRSGKVVSTTGTPITVITLDAADTSHDPTYLNSFEYVTVVGRDGTIKADNIPITAVSGTTVTVSSYTLSSGEAIAAGDYVIADRYSINKTELPDTCESVLLKHVEYEARYGDSSNWTDAVREDLASKVAQIIASFGLNSDDITQVPIVNFDYLMM